jgi:Ca2+-binding EF-hand superfamily protein
MSTILLLLSDFREFIIALWNYLTIGDATLGLFTFDLYDKDCSGTLSYEEIEMMLKEIYGPHFHSNKNAGSVIPYLQHHSKRKGVVDLDDFEVFAKNHASLFFPSFELQKSLQ